MSQITIYDLLPEEPRPDFHTMTAEQIVNYLNEVLGVNFTWNERLQEYTVNMNTKNYGKFMLEFELDSYTLSDDPKNGQPFLGCGYSWSKGGSASPCDSLEEAIKFYKRYL